MHRAARGFRRDFILLPIVFAIAVLPSNADVAENVRLVVTPTASAVDQSVHVTIVGLAPGERITLIAEQQRFGFPLRSAATFTIGRSGSLDLSKNAPISGDYSGVDPMGPFWSMRLSGTPHFAATPEAELTPFDATLKVLRGAKTLASATIHRYIVAPSTRHVEINRDGLVASYFEPADGARHPAIIVLNGSDGGLQRDTAALLARHGFCTLAVAYFGIGSLPRVLSDIPIESVERAVNFLRTMPGVDASKIGVVGFSKGAELALVSASHFSSIRAVVAYAPSSAVFEGLGSSAKATSSWTFGGRELPFANGEVPAAVQQQLDAATAAHQPVSYAPWYLAKLRGSEPQALIAVESIEGPVMVVAGGHDKLWPSATMAAQIAARLREHHHPYADNALIYPSAGHAIEVPYVPTPHTITAGDLLLGGTASANAQADGDSWPRVIAFLEAALK
jgi:dienelactone hydrolase